MVYSKFYLDLSFPHACPMYWLKPQLPPRPPAPRPPRKVENPGELERKTESIVLKILDLLFS